MNCRYQQRRNSNLMHWVERSAETRSMGSLVGFVHKSMHVYKTSQRHRATSYRMLY